MKGFTKLLLIQLTIFLSITMVGKKVYGQHAQLFSQYLFNGTALNPAYTGSRDALSMSFSFRKQWAGLKGSPMNQSFTAHTPLKDRRNNIGLLFFNDHYGVTNYSAVFGSYAFRFDFKEKGRLAMGLQAGASFTKNNYLQLILNDEDDPEFSENSPLIVTPRAGFGLYYDHDKFFVGLSVPQIIQISDKGIGSTSNFDFDYYFLTAGYLWEINPLLKLKPTVLLRYLRSSPFSFDASANLIIKDKYWIGVSYRHKSSMIVMFEYQITHQFRLGYSYDQAITKLARYNAGSHELYLRYEFRYKMKGESPRFF